MPRFRLSLYAFFARSFMSSMVPALVSGALISKPSPSKPRPLKCIPRRRSASRMAWIAKLYCTVPVLDFSASSISMEVTCSPKIIRCSFFSSQFFHSGSVSA